MKHIFYTALIVCLLCSCSASWHLKRACIKDPSLCQSDTIIKLDTVIRYDTAYLDSKVDTVFDYDQADTVTLIKDRLVIKYVYKDRKVYLSGESKDLIITKTITINRDRVITRTRTIKESKPWWYPLMYMVFGMTLFFFIDRGSKLFTK